MRKLVITFLLLLSAHNIYSQDMEYMSMAFRVGGGISTMKGLDRYRLFQDKYSGRPSISNKFAWDFGLVFQTGFKNDFFFQTEGIASAGGASIRGIRNVSWDKDMEIRSLETFNIQLNLYLGKKVALSNNFRLFTALGVYLNFDKGDTFDQTNMITGHDLDLKSFDTGFIISAGAEYGKFQFSLNPSFGLVDMTKDKTGVYNRAYKFAITYHFFCTD